MEEPKISQSRQDEIMCRNCGAKLVFEPGTDSLKCGFCGALNEISVDEDEKIKAIQELDFESYIGSQADIAPKIEILAVKCDSCGAETTFDPNIVSSECDFCGSPLVSREAHKTGIIEPKAILPFKINKKAGHELFEKWLKKLWFAPNKLKTRAKRVEDLAGIYTPYWTYDTDTYTEYIGERGDDYETEETSYNDDGEEVTTTVTKTRWTSVSGRVKAFFDDIMVPASNSLSQKHINKLEPWDLENLVPFDTKYLSGFKSETYRVSLEEGFDVAKRRIEPLIRNDIRRDIGGDRQKISSMNTEYASTTFKHILLPIWLSAYKYNNKVYHFMINGRTGEVQGERPWSWIKITLAVLAGLALIGAIIWFSKDA